MTNPAWKMDLREVQIAKYHLDEITTRIRYCMRNSKRVGAIKRRIAWEERAVTAQAEGEKLFIRLLRS